MAGRSLHRHCRLTFGRSGFGKDGEPGGFELFANGDGARSACRSGSSFRWTRPGRNSRADVEELADACLPGQVTDCTPRKARLARIVSGASGHRARNSSAATWSAARLCAPPNKKSYTRAMLGPSASWTSAGMSVTTASQPALTAAWSPSIQVSLAQPMAGMSWGITSSWPGLMADGMGWSQTSRVVISPSLLVQGRVVPAGEGVARVAAWANPASGDGSLPQIPYPRPTRKQPITQPHTAHPYRPASGGTGYVTTAEVMAQALPNLR